LFWGIVKWILFFAGAYLSCRIILPRLARFLWEIGFTRKNYLGEEIPTGVGLLFALLVPGWMGLGVLLRLDNYTTQLTNGLDKTVYLPVNVFLFLFVALGMAFIGFVDDVFGNQDAKGFKGHFAALLHGKITSGALKALFGGVVAAVFSAGLLVLKSGQDPWYYLVYEFLINLSLIALAANLINLLDLRPGRAGKAFILMLVFVFFFAKKPELFALIVPVLGILLAYLDADLKAWVMMGDVGSNMLGGILGVMMAVCLHPTRGKLVAFFILLGLNILSEFCSFSRLIEQNRILRAFDQLGRRRRN
jgi:UDP-GlcNAc:undecaprenyl-phosphate GlcNAc-1-phosphate transferase